MKNLNLFHRDLPTQPTFTVAGAPPREAHVWLKRYLPHLGERIGARKRLFSPIEALELGIFARLDLLTSPSSAARWCREIRGHIEEMVERSEADTIDRWRESLLGDDPVIHAIHVAHALEGTVRADRMSCFESAERNAYETGGFPATYIRVPAIGLACQIFEDAIRTRLLAEEFRHRETIG